MLTHFPRLPGDRAHTLALDLEWEPGIKESLGTKRHPSGSDSGTVSGPRTGVAVFLGCRLAALGYKLQHRIVVWRQSRPQGAHLTVGFGASFPAI